MNKKCVMGVLVGAMAVSCMSVSWAGGIYKWVDEKGVTHFGEKPPGPGVGQKIKVNAPSPSTSEQQQAPTSAATAPAAADNAQKGEVLEDPQAAKARAEVIKKNCEIHRSNLKILRESARIRETGADGQVKMLGEEEKQARVKDAEKFIAENCQNSKP